MPCGDYSPEQELSHRLDLEQRCLQIRERLGVVSEEATFGQHPT